jgi:sirohydrochlorin ferrochelatase
VTVYLLAHGSADPRHAVDVAAIAARLARRLAEDVLPCYLDHCAPTLAEVADRPGVVVPLLFSPGYHVRVDVGQAVAEATVPLTVADPPLLTSAAPWAHELLTEVGRAWPRRQPVLVTAGTRDAAVLARWEETAAALGVPVCHASGPGMRPAAAVRGAGVLLPLLVARGHFGDVIAATAQELGVPLAAAAGTSAALVAELHRLVARARAATAGSGAAFPPGRRQADARSAAG